MNPFDDLRLALAHLTRIPVNLSQTSIRPLGEVAAYLPLVGVVVATIGAGVFTAGFYFGLPSFICAILAILIMTLATGSLHEDGIADFADAQGARERTQRLAIMRDSRIGSYGVIALLFVYGLRISSLGVLGSPYLVFNVLLAASALSRAMMAFAMSALPDARSDGLAVAAGRPSSPNIAWAMGIAIGICIFTIGFSSTLAALAASAVVVVLVMAVAHLQLGGKTGDVLGSVQIVSEIAVLIASLGVVGIAE